MPKPFPDITLDDLKEWACRQDRVRSNPVMTGPRSNPFMTTPVISFTRCLYVKDSEHCIAGQFFYDHGITDAMLQSWDTEGQNADRIAERLGCSSSIAETLRDLQRVADDATKHGHEAPWGRAIEAVFEY